MNKNFGAEVVFDDPYALQVDMRCGIVPRQPSVDQFIVQWTEPSASPSSLHLSLW